MIDLVNTLLRKAGLGQLHFRADHAAQLSWMGWGQFAGLLLSILSIKLTTSVGPAEYGLFVLVTSLGGLLSLALFGPLEQGVVRYYFEFSGTDTQRSTYLLMVRSVLLRSALVLAGVAGVSAFLGVLSGTYTWLFMITGGVLVTITVLAAPVNGLLNAMKLRKQLAIIGVVEKVLIVVFLQIGIWFIPMDASTIMLCIVAAMLLLFVVRMMMFGKQIGPEGSTEERNTVRSSAWKKVLAYGWPFIIWGWLSWLQFNGERWVINSMLSMEEVGKYGLAASLVNNSIVMVYNVLIQFVTPTIYAKFSDQAADRKGGFQLIRGMAWATFALFVAFGLFLYAAGGWIIRLLSTSAFVLDTGILLFLTIGLGLFYVGQTLAMVGFALERPDAYLIPKIISSVVSVAGYIAGCFWFGLYGIVGAVILGNLFYLGSILIINHRRFPARLA